MPQCTAEQWIIATEPTCRGAQRDAARFMSSHEAAFWSALPELVRCVI